MPLEKYTIFLGNFSNINIATVIVFLFYGAWLKFYIYSFAKKLV
jgi:hypothetical protein